MGLVRQEVDRAQIPHEAGQWVEIRGLVYGERREAEKALMNEVRTELAEAPDIAVKMAEIRASSPEREEKDPDEAAILGSFYWPTVLRHGLARWSYSGDEAPDGTRLDERTMKFVVRSILELSGVEFPAAAAVGGGEVVDTPTKNSSARSTKR